MTHVNPESKEARVRKVRYAYVVLALISCLTAFVAVQISLTAIRNNNQNFCDLVRSSTSTPAIKPANPKADPKAERTWEVYLKIVKLSEKLGCNKLSRKERVTCSSATRYTTSSRPLRR